MIITNLTSSTVADVQKRLQSSLQCFDCSPSFLPDNVRHRGVNSSVMLEFKFQPVPGMEVFKFIVALNAFITVQCSKASSL